MGTSLLSSCSRATTNNLEIDPSNSTQQDKAAKGNERATMVLASDGLVDQEFGADAVLRMTLLSSPDANKGRWFANQGKAIQKKLCDAYSSEPYPSKQQMERLARNVKAPSVDCIQTFYKCMQTKSMELCGH